MTTPLIKLTALTPDQISHEIMRTLMTLLSAPAEITETVEQDRQTAVVYMRDLVTEAERRGKLMHKELQDIKSEVTKPKEQVKKLLEVAAENGRTALRAELERMGVDKFQGVTLVHGSGALQLPLPDSTDYDNLIAYLLKHAPGTLKITVVRGAFDGWVQDNPAQTKTDLIDSGLVDMVFPTHVRI